MKWKKAAFLAVYVMTDCANKNTKIRNEWFVMEKVQEGDAQAYKPRSLCFAFDLHMHRKRRS
jgi:hypothetical protein